MATCLRCGATVGEGEAFCPACGAAVEKESVKAVEKVIEQSAAEEKKEPEIATVEEPKEEKKAENANAGQPVQQGRFDGQNGQGVYGAPGQYQQNRPQYGGQPGQPGQPGRFGGQGGQGGYGQPQYNQYGQPQNNRYGQPQNNQYGQPQNNQYGGQPHYNQYNQPQNNQYGGQPQYNQYGQQPYGQPYGQPGGQRPYGAPNQGAVPGPASYTNNQAPLPGSEYETVGIGGYMGFMFLFAIPVIGWIIAIVVACGGSKRVNLRNFAKAYLIWLAIAIVLTIVAVVLFMTVFERYFYGVSSLFRYFY